MPPHNQEKPPDTDTGKFKNPEKMGFKLTIPMMISSVIAIVTATVYSVNWLNKFSDKIDRMEHKIDAITANVWTIEDHQNYSMAFQINNPTLKVPNVEKIEKTRSPFPRQN